MRATLAILALLAGGCAEQATVEPKDDGRAVPPDPTTLPSQGSSLLGEPLMPLDLPPETLAAHQRKWREADEAYAADPDSLEATIWLGRRAAYLGDYRAAIATFSAGLRKHPDSPRLLRHRGHRYLTVREIGRAIEDLERAARLVEGKSDVVEPDGLPNERGVPTSTLQSNIWYHLGLARYVSGDLEGAERAYRRGLVVSTNPDMLSAMTYWAYLTARKLGRAEAEALLAPIEPDFDIIENDGYHKLLLLYAGDPSVDVDDLKELRGAPGSVAFATVGYGLALHAHFEADEASFRRRLEQIVAAGQWPAFGHLAAEAELRRMRNDG